MNEPTEQWAARHTWVANMVYDERISQLEKWGVQSHDLDKWLVILTEEVGELAKAILEHDFACARTLDTALTPDSQSVKRMSELYKPAVEKEAIQVAAVASAIVQYLRNGEA